MTAERPFAFICYKREVEPVVAALSASLGKRMVTTWYDTDVDAGTSWRKELKERLHACSALIVVVAPEIKDLTWLQREIGVARSLGKTIFPVVLPGAGSPDLEKLGVGRLQALRLVGDEPPEKWIRSVHDALYLVEPAVKAPVPVPIRAAKRGAVIVAVGIAGLVIGGLAGWFLHHPANLAATGAPGREQGACGGRAARIDTISTVSPGHTGYAPLISVTVCAAAGQGHSYWLADYTAGTDGRRFYAKAELDGSTGTRPYRIVHDKTTGLASSRTYLVLDVPPEMAVTVSQQWINPDGAPLVAPGTDLPAGVTSISNEAPAVL